MACDQLSDADRMALFECGAILSDMSASELPQILDGLIRLRENQSRHVGSCRFQKTAAPNVRSRMHYSSKGG